MTQHPPIRPIRILFGLLVLTSLAACKTFTPLPLEQVDSNTPSDLSTLSVPPDSLGSTELRPVKVNPRDGVSPDEASIIAVVLNPQLRALRSARGIAQAQVLQAGILPNPQISAGADLVVGGNTLGTQTGRVLGVSWDLTSLLAMQSNVAAAREKGAQVELDIAWAEWQTALGAQSASYNLASLQSQLALADDVEGDLRKNLAAVSTAAEARDLTAVDLSAAQTATDDAYQVSLDLGQQRDHARISLNRALGLPPTDKRATPPTGFQLPARVKPPRLSSVLANLAEKRLDLRALERGYESQNATLRSSIIGQFPKVGLGFGRSTDTSNVQMINPNVSIDLPIFDRNQGNIALHKATRQQLRDEYAARLAEARSDVASAHGNVVALNNRLDAARKAIPSMEKLVSTYKQSFDNGDADIVTYYGARSNLAQKKINLLVLQQQLMQNWIALEIASGTYLTP